MCVKHVAAKEILVVFLIFAAQHGVVVSCSDSQITSSPLICYRGGAPAGQCSSASQIDITQAKVSSDLLYGCLLPPTTL